MPDRSQTGEVREWYRQAQHALSMKDYRRAHQRCLEILDQAPQFSGAFFLLGIIAAEHGNLAKAAELIERALRIDPDRAEYHAQLGRCLVALHRPREALETASRALALAPADALTLDTIGVVMTRVAAHVEAVEPFRRAVQRAPGNASYLYNLASALQFVGELAEAAQLFRAVLALQPDNYRAWSALAQVTSAPFSAAEVQQLEDMLGRNLDPDAQLHVCHALAKQCEDQGRYAKAFSYLQQGKQRKRASIRYSIEQDAALFDAVRRVCTPEFIAAPASGCNSPEPIFIIGMPRTGTTLVERILSSHPQVFSAGELSNFSVALKRAVRTSSNLVLDAPTLAAAASVDLAAVGESYVESTRPRTGHTPHFIDKMPLNFLYAGFIRRALPRARIICVRRNALDTCLSNYRQLFATSFLYYNYAYDLLDIGRYYLLFEDLLRYWRAHLGDRYCEVEYEAVVSSTEREARRLIEFCALQWDPACLHFHENAAPVATASAAQVRQPIYSTSVERWRKYEKEIAPLQELLAERRGVADGG